MEVNAYSKLDTRVVSKEGVAHIFVNGKLNKSTSDQLQQLLDETEEKDIELDFSGLQYLSSAGLRVLIATLQRLQAKEGSLIIKNVSPEVAEVFEITGLAGMLLIR